MAGGVGWPTVMGLHPITAGHGYTYLTRQTVVQDASSLPAGGIGAYYAERGESPGQWSGRGLTGLGVAQASMVSEAQMVALFGAGRHPDAAHIRAGLKAEGADHETIEVATALGRPFAVNPVNTEFAREVIHLAADWARQHGRPAPAEVAARIRTAVGRAMFAREHGHEADARELSGFIAQQSRLGSKAIAGFDLTFSPVKSVSALWALAPPDTARQIEAAHHAAITDTLDWLERTATFIRLGHGGVRQVDVQGLVAASFTHRTSRAGDPDLHTHVAVSNKVQTLDGRWRALDGRVLFKAAVAASERYNTRLEAELRQRLGVTFVEHARPGKRPVRELAGIDDGLLRAWSRRRADIDAVREQLAIAFQDEHSRPPTPTEAIGLAQRATLSTRPDKHEPTSEAELRERWRREAATALGAERLRDMLAAVDLRRSASAAPTPDQLSHIARLVLERVQSDRATWQRWHILAETQRAVRSLELPVAALDPVVDRIADLVVGECVPLHRDDSIHAPAELRRADSASVYSVAGSLMFTSDVVLEAERAVITAAQKFDGRRVDESAVSLALLEATANGLPLNDGQAEFVRALASSGARCQLALAPAGTGKTTALRVLARAWTEAGGRVVALAPSAAAAQLLGESIDVRADTIAKLVHDLDRSGRSSIGADTLVVVDEAGMASTADLARIVDHAIRACASVRLVGDDRQLAAIGAGGVLRDLAETSAAVTLQIAVRFTDPAEAAAALGVRSGSHTAVQFYLDHGRIRVGDEHTAALSAYTAWEADRAAGHDSLLIAATREQAAALNTRARTNRLHDDGQQPQREVRLSDGCAASAGDAIITRRNDRRLAITATDWVKNGDRWTVQAVRPGGGIDAIHQATRRRVRLPADYVAEHVTLGYAVTIHLAQGTTADTCHTVLTGAETREQLYVALTRGRHANHVHVVVPGAADEHAAIRRDTLIPPTAVDLVLRVLDREGAQRSATTEQKVIADPAKRLRDACARYVDTLSIAPATRTGRPTAPAPLPWLEPVPECGDPSWRTYLAARAAQITAFADEVTHTSARQPGDLMYPAHLALWSATHPPGSDTEVPSEREALYRRHLTDRRADLHSGRVRDPRRRWVALVAAVDRQALAAPQWPALAAAMTRAFQAGLDVDRMLPELLQDQRYTTAVAELSKLADGADRNIPRPAPQVTLEPQMSRDRGPWL